jgi:hypothetical protein
VADTDDRKFVAAIETFINEIQEIMLNNGEQRIQMQPDDGEQNAQTRPIAAKQKQYMLANLAAAKLLHSIGRPSLAEPFLLLAEALQDQIDKGEATKRGRPFDTTETWRLRAYLCVGIRYLIASDMTQKNSDVKQDDAITSVIREYRTQFQKLLRTRAALESSIRTWLKDFATDAITNEVALWAYKEGMRQLEQEIKTPTNGTTTLRQQGKNLIKATAVLANQVVKI